MQEKTGTSRPDMLQPVRDTSYAWEHRRMSVYSLNKVLPPCWDSTPLISDSVCSLPVSGLLRKHIIRNIWTVSGRSQESNIRDHDILYQTFMYMSPGIICYSVETPTTNGSGVTPTHSTHKWNDMRKKSFNLIVSLLGPVATDTIRLQKKSMSILVGINACAGRENATACLVIGLSESWILP